MDNRWLVQVISEEVADYLVHVGINLYNRHIFIRHYDDVLAEEYKEYLEYLGIPCREYLEYVEHRNID